MGSFDRLKRTFLVHKLGAIVFELMLFEMSSIEPVQCPYCLANLCALTQKLGLKLEVEWSFFLFEVVGRN